MDRHSSSVPITVLTGFLGSGKTTVLNGLLRHPDMANTAVVVNEFGEIGLDHLLVRSSEETIVLLDSGCLCCTINNTLRETLVGLWIGRVRSEIPKFDRVLVETTGLAEPGPIMQAINSDTHITDHYHLNGVVTCVDALNFFDEVRENREVTSQIAVADRLLLTKTDLTSASENTGVELDLAKLNPGAMIQRIVKGVVLPEQVLNAGLYGNTAGKIDVVGWLREHAYAHPKSKSEIQVNTRHQDSIRANCFFIGHPVSWAGLAGWCGLMGETFGKNLLRVKGLIGVNEANKPVIVHGVYGVFDKPVRLNHWPTDDQRSRLVVIGRNIHTEDIQVSLAVLKLPSGSERPASLAQFDDNVKREER